MASTIKERFLEEYQITNDSSLDDFQRSRKEICYFGQVYLNYFFKLQIVSMKDRIPLQLNGKDCGVFVTMYIDLILHCWKTEPESFFDNFAYSSCYKSNVFNIHQDISGMRMTIKELMKDYY